MQTAAMKIQMCVDLISDISNFFLLKLIDKVCLSRHNADMFCTWLQDRILEL